MSILSIVNTSHHIPSSGGNITVKVGLSNYAIKTDLKNAAHVDVNSLYRNQF